jgi:hypothetical protein
VGALIYHAKKIGDIMSNSSLAAPVAASFEKCTLNQFLKENGNIVKVQLIFTALAIWTSQIPQQLLGLPLSFCFLVMIILITKNIYARMRQKPSVTLDTKLLVLGITLSGNPLVLAFILLSLLT